MSLDNEFHGEWVLCCSRALLILMAFVGTGGAGIAAQQMAEAVTMVRDHPPRQVPVRGHCSAGLTSWPSACRRAV